MEIDFEISTSEIMDFLCTNTLYEIDCGILDLGHVDAELKSTLRYLEALLTSELLLNYRINCTGIFRVYRFGDIWCYCERHCVIAADSCRELEDKVVSQNRIWYVFDEYQASKVRR